MVPDRKNRSLRDILLTPAAYRFGGNSPQVLKKLPSEVLGNEAQKKRN
jgi:hypothetical protein